MVEYVQYKVIPKEEDFIMALKGKKNTSGKKKNIGDRKSVV